jgi:hypothetical protein
MSSVIIPHYRISRNDVTPLILADPLALAVPRAMRHAGPVSMASQDLSHHLGVLQHATDNELALAWFLKEFNY